jgi:hypothetical protein
MKLHKCFDKNYVFFHEGYLYEKMDITAPYEFRIILDVDDYDYVEDKKLIKQLRDTWDSYRLSDKAEIYL